MPSSYSIAPPGFVRKSTVFIFVVTGFLLGFLAGIILTIYKLPPSAPAPPTAIPGGAAPGVDPAALQRRLTELESEAAARPDNPDTWARIGDVHFDLNQPEKAIAAYKQSLDLNPANADIWTDMGVMYRRLGQPQAALEAFDQAITVNPEHEISRYNKGVVLMHDLEDPPGAIAAWEDLLKINPFAVTGTGQPLRDMLELLKQRINQ